MRITLAQVPSTLGDVDANIARAAEIVGEAGQDGSDLVVFPELYLTGYALGRSTRTSRCPPTTRA